MARIEKPDITAYKVELTEYERGWGQKPYDTWYFDNEAEARRCAIEYNQDPNLGPFDGIPDWYVRAEYVGKVG